MGEHASAACFVFFGLTAVVDSHIFRVAYGDVAADGGVAALRGAVFPFLLIGVVFVFLICLCEVLTAKDASLARRLQRLIFGVPLLVAIFAILAALQPNELSATLKLIPLQPGPLSWQYEILAFLALTDFGIRMWERTTLERRVMLARR